LAWLLLSVGLQGRSLRISLVLAPVVMISYGIGLPYGPKGVALAYSTAMVLWMIPHTLWCLKGTSISFFDLMRTLRYPFVSGIVAALGALVVQQSVGSAVGPFPRLVLGGSCMVGLYVSMLLLVFRQKSFYVDLVKGMKRSARQQTV
jgi:PST family polysaccharide transporter